MTCAFSNEVARTVRPAREDCGQEFERGYRAGERGAIDADLGGGLISNASPVKVGEDRAAIEWWSPTERKQGRFPLRLRQERTDNIDADELLSLRRSHRLARADADKIAQAVRIAPYWRLKMTNPSKPFGGALIETADDMRRLGFWTRPP